MIELVEHGYFLPLSPKELVVNLETEIDGDDWYSNNIHDIVCIYFVKNKSNNSNPKM